MIARLDAAKLAALRVPPLSKGLPFDAPELRLDEIGTQGWNLLEGDLPLPLALESVSVNRNRFGIPFPC